jgi:hypothetical protein
MNSTGSLVEKRRGTTTDNLNKIGVIQIILQQKRLSFELEKTNSAYKHAVYEQEMKNYTDNLAAGHEDFQTLRKDST